MDEIINKIKNTSRGYAVLTYENEDVLQRSLRQRKQHDDLEKQDQMFYKQQ